jgi:hypothetical protein
MAPKILFVVVALVTLLPPKILPPGGEENIPVPVPAPNKLFLGAGGVRVVLVVLVVVMTLVVLLGGVGLILLVIFVLLFPLKILVVPAPNKLPVVVADSPPKIFPGVVGVVGTIGLLLVLELLVKMLIYKKVYNNNINLNNSQINKYIYIINTINIMI